MRFIVYTEDNVRISPEATCELLPELFELLCSGGTWIRDVSNNLQFGVSEYVSSERIYPNLTLLHFRSWAERMDHYIATNGWLIVRLGGSSIPFLTM